MDPIRKEYIFDEHNRKIAVQIDIETFERIEQILEDYALDQLIRKNEQIDTLDLIEAENLYNSLGKSK